MNSLPDTGSVRTARPAGRGRPAVIAAIIAVTMIVSVVLTVLVLSAIGFRRADDTASIVFENTPENATALQKLKFYLDTVKTGYLEEQTDAQLIERLTEGLPAALGNPYTYYLYHIPWID